MKYGSKITIRWTPRLKAKIILFLVFIFIIGAALGFVIGRVSAANRNKAPDEIPTEQTITPIKTPENTLNISSTEPPDSNNRVYYDCPLSKELQDYIRYLCEENDFPMTVVIAMIDVESSFRADVISKTNDYGLMQINISNHGWLDEEYGITDLLDPYQNVFSGITIISEHYKNYGDLDKALMAYNHGSAGAKRKWNKGIYSTSYTEKVRNAMEGYEGVLDNG